MPIDPFLSLRREASNSILTFLADVFDLANSSKSEQYISRRDAIVIPRGHVILRILIAALTGALPSSRLEPVFLIFMWIIAYTF